MPAKYTGGANHQVCERAMHKVVFVFARPVPREAVRSWIRNIPWPPPVDVCYSATAGRIKTVAVDFDECVDLKDCPPVGKITVKGYTRRNPKRTQ